MNQKIGRKACFPCYEVEKKRLGASAGISIEATFTNFSQYFTQLPD